MVGFRRGVAGTGINDWWDNGANAIAVSRGGPGFVAIHLETTSTTVAAQTALAPGTYCDLLSGAPVAAGCAGRRIVIDSDGHVHFDLAAGKAVALLSGNSP